MRSHRRHIEWLLERIAVAVETLAARNHTDHLALARVIQSEGDTLMSVVSDKISEVDTRVDAARDRVLLDIATLQAKIVELQALVDAGGATAADLAALDALKVKLDQIDPATATTI